MDFLFDLKRQRTALQAVLFYVCHLLVVMGGSMAASFITAGYAPKGLELGVAYLTGQFFAIVYVSVLCVRAIMQRKLPAFYYGSVVLALPVVYYAGAFGGLIIAAILIMLPGATTNATQASKPVKATAPATAAMTAAPVRVNKPRSQFGQRAARS